MAGAQIINIMRVVQTRGIKIRCIVPMVAASMAFQILAECDERYAFNYSFLLWHPIRVNMQGPLTPSEARKLAKSMEYYENVLIKVLLEKLNMDEDEFYYHYYEETLHFAETLETIAPDFLDIVDDVQGARNLFSMRK